MQGFGEDADSSSRAKVKVREKASSEKKPASAVKKPAAKAKATANKTKTIAGAALESLPPGIAKQVVQMKDFMKWAKAAGSKPLNTRPGKKKAMVSDDDSSSDPGSDSSGSGSDSDDDSDLESDSE